MRNKKMEKN